MKELIIDSLSAAMSGIIVLALVIMASASGAEPIVADDSDVVYDEAIRGFNEKKWPEVHCMALNVYYETRGSNIADSYAVADVVLNRVEDARFPGTICDVVKDGYRKGRRDCQFSWYCDGKADTPHEEEAWARAQSVAWMIVQMGKYRGISEGATNYHAHYVNPRWNRSSKGYSITRIGRIGDHIFYRWN